MRYSRRMQRFLVPRSRPSALADSDYAGVLRQLRRDGPGRLRRSEQKVAPWRAFGRGVVAAMAMTGMRRVTTGLGLVRVAPPESIAKQGVPSLLARVPSRFQDVAIELAHWGYGGAASGVFAFMPRRFQHMPAAGPVFGLAIWLAFDKGIAPALKLIQAERPHTVERLALMGDHILYGVLVAESRDRSH